MTQTTIMRDSQVGDEWIRQAYSMNPPRRVTDQNGQPNGNLLTGPVRLAFTEGLMEARKLMESDPNSRVAYSCAILFPPMSDLSIFWEDYCTIAQREFPNNPWNATAGQFIGLEPYVRDQGEKANYSGYTPGCKFMNVSSGFKPPIVDSRMNPIVDKSQVYPGMWAIVAVSCYPAGKGKPKKGPRFGLQTVMKIADDTNLAGAAPDPRAMYAGINVSPPASPIAQQFGAAPPQQPVGNFGQAGVAQIYGQPSPMQPAPAQPTQPGGFDPSKFGM